MSKLESIQEIDAYEKKEPEVDISIQDALTALAVYVADIDPRNCSEDIKHMVEISKQQPEFLEIDEDEESAEKRMNRFINEMQDSSQAKKIIDRSIRIISPDMTQSVIDWVDRTCKAIGLTEARKMKLYEIKAKLNN
jgi:hypothetical protein